MRLLRFALGPVVAVLMLMTGPLDGMSSFAWRTAALGAWMALWWVTEAVPIAATALLPLALLPLLGITNVNAAAAPYANPVIFLFFGGFILAAAFERSGLHRRLALALLSAVGTRPDRIVGGFMLAAGVISMWVSNTATVLMLLPLVNSMLRRGRSGTGEPVPPTDFERSLLLGIAYAASIGGLGTLIGTPPNALLAGFVEQTHGVHLSFVRFMLIGVPVIAVGLPISWFILTRVVYRVRGNEAIMDPQAVAAQRVALGSPSRQEKFVALVAASTATAWISQPWLARAIPGLSEAGIGVLCALVLFVVPIDRSWTRVLDWQAAEDIPWGVLVLFGGGLSLAGAIQESGLAQWIGNSVGGLRALPPLLLVLMVTTVVTFLTEFTSNTATAAVFLPIASSLAIGAGMNPLLLVVPAALAASIGFMLPVGTPPNAIVFASGRLTIPQMARAGFLLDILFILLVTAASYVLVLPVLG